MSYAVGQQLEFTANVYGGVPSYSFAWSFGDGTTASTNPAYHTYSSAGTYTVTVQVTDSIGETASASTSVTIAQQQTITVTFDESGLPDGVNWSINFSGYTYSATSPDPIQVTVPAGSYNWTANEVTVNTGTGEYCYYKPVSPTSGTVSSSTTITITYSLYKCYTV